MRYVYWIVKRELWLCSVFFAKKKLSVIQIKNISSPVCRNFSRFYKSKQNSYFFNESRCECVSRAANQQSSEYPLPFAHCEINKFIYLFITVIVYCSLIVLNVARE